MRACSFVCIIGVVFLFIDQFYSGLNWERLFIGGFVITRSGQIANAGCVAK